MRFGRHGHTDVLSQCLRGPIIIAAVPDDAAPQAVVLGDNGVMADAREESSLLGSQCDESNRQSRIKLCGSGSVVG